jgi:hypothetical protein
MVNAVVPAALREIELSAWLGQAAKGDALEYHRGFLALDLVPARFPDPAKSELARVAGLALWAAERGLVHLVQRRLGPDNFSYVIIARGRPVQVAMLERRAA